MRNHPVSRFVYERRVEFADTDMAGILHFSSYFRYVEEAEHAFLRSVGLSVYETVDSNVVSWPRVSASCDFHRPARFAEILRIGVSVEKLGTKSIHYRFSIAVDDRPVATARMVAACCRLSDEHGIEAIAIPASIRARLESVHQSDEVM